MRHVAEWSLVAMLAVVLAARAVAQDRAGMERMQDVFREQQERMDQMQREMQQRMEEMRHQQEHLLDQQRQEQERQQDRLREQQRDVRQRVREWQRVAPVPARPLRLRFEITGYSESFAVSTVQDAYRLMAQHQTTTSDGKTMSATIRVEGTVSPEAPRDPAAATAYRITAEGSAQIATPDTTNLEFSASTMLRPGERAVLVESGPRKLVLYLEADDRDGGPAEAQAERPPET